MAGSTVVVAGWSALYLAGLPSDAAIIPVAQLTWPATATAVAAGIVGSRCGARTGVLAGLVAVTPVVAVDAVGWALHGDGALGACLTVLPLDGLGIAPASALALTGSPATAGPSRPT